MIKGLLEKTGLTSKITRKELEKFIEVHRDSGLTLDIGCGHAFYREYFPNRIGFDIQSGPRVDIVGDAHKLPFENEKFDNILCTEVLEHLHSPQIAISEMKRVLKKGGKLILTTRFLFPIHDAPEDYYRYTKYGLKHLFRDWEIIELKEELSTSKTINALLQRVGYQCDMLGGKPAKLLFFILIKVFSIPSFLIRKEYGAAFPRRHEEKNIMTTGYYLVCRKK